jgi:hypothetical protein
LLKLDPKLKNRLSLKNFLFLKFIPNLIFIKLPTFGASKIHRKMHTDELLHRLRETQHRTLAFFDLDEVHLSKSYADGKWTIREILHHLADAETVLYDRVRRIIAEPRQVLWAFQQDCWCSELQYADRPLELNKAIYHAVREGVIDLAARFYEPLGDKEFVHSETGVRTLKEEFEKFAWHNEGHLQQIETALQR